MWKDFFYYSKSERRAVVILMSLIAILVVAIVLAPDKAECPEKATSDSLALKNRRALAGKSSGDGRQGADVRMELYHFDPNSVDSIGLLRLGLSPFVVRNVIKYRNKGGRFATPESFSRIYGLTDDKFQELKPYIRISESFRSKKKREEVSFAGRKRERKDSIIVYKYPEGTLVDVNLADTTELKKIPGIGSGISKAIVAYRTRLGGFCSLEQLLEVKYVTPDLLEWFKLENVSLRKLNVNKASLEKLRSHPYLNFYQAKVIVEYRRTRGNIKSLSQLSLYEEFTEKDLLRLSAYVSFD